MISWNFIWFFRLNIHFYWRIIHQLSSFIFWHMEYIFLCRLCIAMFRNIPSLKHVGSFPRHADKIYDVKYCVLYGCNEYENNFVPCKYEIYIKTTVNIELMSALAVYLWVKILPSKCWPSLTMSVLITGSKWSTVPLLCQDLEPILFFKILVILFMQMQMCTHQLFPATKVLIHTGPAFGHHHGSRWLFVLTKISQLNRHHQGIDK